MELRRKWSPAAQIRLAWNRLPYHVRYVLLLFMATRAILTVIGALALSFIGPLHPREDSFQHWIYPQVSWLKMWGLWDSGWYLDIAQHGYSIKTHLPGDIQANVGFFPLYPLLIRLLTHLTGSYFIAGLIISNLFLIVAALLLYQLLRLDYDEETTLKAVKYLFLFPTAFILSGVFTESLFLALSLLCFYCARKDKWLLAGLAGYLAALTRSTGVLLVVPMGLLYLQTKRFRLRECRLNVLWLGLIPAGVLSFGFYDYLRFGDFMVYSHMQQTGWGHHFTEPMSVIVQGLISADKSELVDAWFLAATLLLLTYDALESSIPYWVYSILVLLATPATGMVFGTPRYLCTLFPLFIILSKLTRTQESDQLLSTVLALLQGCLMVFWTNGFWFIS